MSTSEVFVRGARRYLRVAIQQRNSARARSCAFDRRIDRGVMRAFARDAVECARLSGQPLPLVFATTIPHSAGQQNAIRDPQSGGSSS